jgi:hypothetical protein
MKPHLRFEENDSVCGRGLRGHAVKTADSECVLKTALKELAAQCGQPRIHVEKAEISTRVGKMHGSEQTNRLKRETVQVALPDKARKILRCGRRTPQLPLAASRKSLLLAGCGEQIGEAAPCALMQRIPPIISTVSG